MAGKVTRVWHHTGHMQSVLMGSLEMSSPPTYISQVGLVGFTFTFFSDASKLEVLWTVGFLEFLLHQCKLTAIFSALVGHQEEHPAHKNWVMRCWHGYPSGVRCSLFAYGPKPHHLLRHLNPDWFTFLDVWKRGR